MVYYGTIIDIHILIPYFIVVVLIYTLTAILPLSFVDRYCIGLCWWRRLNVIIIVGFNFKLFEAKTNCSLYLIWDDGDNSPVSRLSTRLLVEVSYTIKIPRYICRSNLRATLVYSKQKTKHHDVRVLALVGCILRL